MTVALPQFLNRKERRAMEKQGQKIAPANVAPELRERPSVAICLPFEEQTYGKWVTKSLIPLMSNMSDRDFVVTVEGAFIDTARRVLAEQALSSDAEYLYWVDTDNIPPEGALERLLSHGKDIVGGWYGVKKSPHGPCVYDYAGYDAAKDWHNYRPRMEVPQDPNAPKCHCGAHHAQHIEKIDGLGFGTMLIHRRVFEAITEQWFSTKQGTEDLWFQRLALEKGYSTYVDWGVHAAHLGIFAC